MALPLGPLYNTAENSIGRSRSLAQDMVIGRKGRYAEEDEKTINDFIQAGVLRMSSVFSKALRLPKKLDLRRTLLLKSVCHIGIHVIFSSMYNVLHQRTRGRSVRPNPHGRKLA